MVVICPGGISHGGLLSGGYMSEGICLGFFCLGGICPNTHYMTSARKWLLEFYSDKTTPSSGIGSVTSYLS